MNPQSGSIPSACLVMCSLAYHIPWGVELVRRERVKSFSANNNPSWAVAQVAPLRPFPLSPWWVTLMLLLILIPIHTPHIIMANNSVPACLSDYLTTYAWFYLSIQSSDSSKRFRPSNAIFLTLRHIDPCQGSDYGNLFDIQNYIPIWTKL